MDAGPFSTTFEYFNAVGQAAINKLDTSPYDDSVSWERIGILVFRDIVSKTMLFKDSSSETLFALNHMDLGTQNILVDEHFKFLAILDWEFSQTAPWQVNHYPMPFPLRESDAEIKDILQDSSHPAHKNVSRQEFARNLYRQKFQSAQKDLEKGGTSVKVPLSQVFDSPASRIYACFATLGRLPQADRDLVYEMVRLAFGWDAREAEAYLHDIEHAAKV